MISPTKRINPLLHPLSLPSWPPSTFNRTIKIDSGSTNAVSRAKTTKFASLRIGSPKASHKPGNCLYRKATCWGSGRRESINLKKTVGRRIWRKILRSEKQNFKLGRRRWKWRGKFRINKTQSGCCKPKCRVWRSRSTTESDKKTQLSKIYEIPTIEWEDSSGTK